MFLFSLSDLTLPLKDPILLFSLLLFIILFAPILLNKIKIPHLIGLIIAGAIIGPNGLNLMLRDSSIILFGTVGLLYIMFLAGLEIDMGDFKKNSGKSIYFGMLTFLIPMGIGTAGGYYVLQYPLPTSILLASMFASHTLIAYPIVSKLGIAKDKAVNIAVGGTVITDTLALLVLAVIVGMSVGEITDAFWWRLSISVILFGAFVMIVFPMIGRWFFKRYEDSVSQYIFVLAMVYLGSFLAEVAGVEAIIGAFLAGLALNRLIPHTSPLMNRIEFVGNALFIPFFLIGVGMLIDFSAFFKDFETIKVAIVMTVIALFTKFMAAWITQKTFGFSIDQRRLIFGLSSAQAAATLAAVLVGYNIILNQEEIEAGVLAGQVVEPVRLLSESILNGTILMILVTCTIASFVAQKGAKNLVMGQSTDSDEDKKDSFEKILLLVNNVDTVEELVNLSITVKSKKNKSGMFALNVVNTHSEEKDLEKNARKILDKAMVTASSTDNSLTELMRYDNSVVNGITGVVKEHKITDLILGIHKSESISESFLGELTEGVLSKSNVTTMVYKSSQPLNTIKRHVVIVPEKAEKEIGFPFWLLKIWNIAKNTGAQIVFYAPLKTLKFIREVYANHPIELKFEDFENWDDFLILSREIKEDDNLIVVLSRKDYLSYNKGMSNVPSYLDKYFASNNFLLIYPMQAGVMDHTAVNYKNPSVLNPLQENLEKLDDIGKTIGKIFKKKNK
jgi:Kef-type K+ transport system membrane component KefB/nucleotide-binding universal stress UspA family protein